MHTTTSTQPDTPPVMQEEWFTLETIEKVPATTDLHCIAVDSPEKQFLIGSIGVPTHNTEEGKAEDALKGEASMIIGSIARLGRAAGVHLVIATQRPDAGIISGETKANLGVRINCGRTDSNASSMILGTAEGTRVRANPRGRLYIRIYGSGNHGQGFFADPAWIDEYLAGQGLNPDGSPITQPRSKLATLTDFDDLADGDLDAREGVDNEGAIERMRQDEVEAQNHYANRMDVDDDDDAWGFEGDADSDSGEEVEPPTDRPLLTNGAGNEDRFHRPEDDWDSELEDLIEENFD